MDYQNTLLVSLLFFYNTEFFWRIILAKFVLLIDAYLPGSWLIRSGDSPAVLQDDIIEVVVLEDDWKMT